MNGTLITIDPGAELFWRVLFEYGPAALWALGIYLLFKLMSSLTSTELPSGGDK